MKLVPALLAGLALVAGSLGTPTGAAVAAPEADRPPVARADRLVTSEDTTISYSGDGVLSNDRDPEGRRLRARLVRGPRHGTAQLDRDGRLVYDPDRNWSGRDVLVYVARDPGGRRDRARVVIRVRPVNDAPRVRMRAQTPVAEGGTSEVTLTATDAEGDALTYLFDCDGDGAFEVEQDTRSHVCPVGDEGTVRVQGRVVDARGAASTVGIDVVVENRAPVVTLPSSGPSGPEDQPLLVDLGSFTDHAPDGPWTATVDWGDGTSTALGAFQAPGSLGSRSHTWAEPGTHQVTVSVREAGGVVGSTFTFAYVTDVAGD